MHDISRTINLAEFEALSSLFSSKRCQLQVCIAVKVSPKYRRSLIFDAHRCASVESASGLALVSRMGQTVNPNAYVVIQVAEYKFRTNVVQRKCDPVWKEEFHL